MGRDSQETDRLLSRRRYAAVLTASSLALAGCSGGGDEGGDENGDDGTNGDSGNNGTDGGSGGNGGGGSGGGGGSQSQGGGSGVTPITRSGSGSTSGDTVQMQDGLVVAEASHSGTGQFEITLEGGQFPKTLATAEGAYDGKEATYTGSREYTLNVVAGGSWDLTIRQPRVDSAESPPVSFSGTGSDVVGPVDFAESGSARMTHDGQFAVAATFYPQLVTTAAPLFRSFGEFESDTVYPSRGISWVDIDADGVWTLEFE